VWHIDRYGHALDVTGDRYEDRAGTGAGNSLGASLIVNCDCARSEVNGFSSLIVRLMRTRLVIVDPGELGGDGVA